MSIKCAQESRWAAAEGTGRNALAAAHASPVMAQRRASERRTTTHGRPIFIRRLARDRVGEAMRKRGPSDGDPTAHRVRAHSTAPGAVS